MAVSTYAAQPNPFRMIQKNKHHEKTPEIDQKGAKALMNVLFKAPEKVVFKVIPSGIPRRAPCTYAGKGQKPKRSLSGNSNKNHP